MLLPDLFETFQNTSLKNYNLHTEYFYTVPGLVWQPLLKTAAEYCEREQGCKDFELCSNEFRLELLTNMDMPLMFEKCIRSGITQAAKRFPKANKKCTKDLYSTDEKSIYLPYVDLNNEYGWAMLQNLPTHGLLWKKAGNLNPKKIDELVKKGKRRFLLLVDVEYPKELQENHNELQFLFEGMKIGREEKLVPNLKDKKGYAVQIKTMIKH